MENPSIMNHVSIAVSNAGPRSDYGELYYGCFVRDPDGHKRDFLG